MTNGTGSPKSGLRLGALLLGALFLAAFAVNTDAIAGACGNGHIDAGESCDLGAANGAPGSCCTVTCGFKSAGTQCRAAAGECDLPETCTGASATCPVDTRAASGTACTDDGNPCTTDRCDGNKVNCQHAPGNAGTLCRAAAGDCDVAESCTGANSNCPADAFLPATTACRPSTVACDDTEYCSGSSAACPADTFVPGTVICLDQSLGTNGNETASTQISLSLTASVDLEHTVIVMVAMDPDAGAVSCSDSRGNTYSLDADIRNGSVVTGVRALAFSARVTTPLASGDTITVTFEHSIAAKAISVAEFVGIGGVDQTASATGNSISPASGATSPTAQPNELVLGVIGVETKLNQTFTAGSGYTMLTRAQSDPTAGNPGRHVTIDPEFRFVSATGSYGADGTLSSPRLWAAEVVTYQAGSVCGDSLVQPGEDCDAGAANGTTGSCCTATCSFSTAGQVCRAAAGDCDAAESCTGSSAACPADAILAAGSPCTDDGNACTMDLCDGVSIACAHPAGNAGAVCRPSAGACDLDELCTGATAVCPPDLKSTSECRPSAGVCDLPESCDGVSNNCPTDGFQAAGTECRASTAGCDPAESCTGSSAACPADAILAAGSPCTDDGNVCTLDLCDGVSIACGHPAGNAGAVCRPSAGACDLDELCTGATAVCPPDLKSTSECRPSAGVCDLPESCDGVSNNCPTDGFQAAGTECRASTAGCDPAESCTGSSAACPADDLNQPSEVSGVALSRDPSTTTIAWNGNPGDLFNVYRGSKRAGTAWSYNQSCIDTAVTDFSITDAVNPGAGTVFYYLVSRVEGACGESVLGRGSLPTFGQGIPMVGQCLGAMVDQDGDGVEDALDNCPDVANSGQSDVDGDDHGDACDNCPNDYDPYQTDTNHNGIGDVCEPTP